MEPFDIQVSIDALFELEEEFRDRKLFQQLKDLAGECEAPTSERIIQLTGQSLHRLDETKPSKETLLKIIQAVPHALSYCSNDGGYLPIQSAAKCHHSNHTLQYIPLLAQEGIKYNVGGKEARGGLLLSHPTHASINVLQKLVGIEGCCRSISYQMLDDEDDDDDNDGDDSMPGLALRGDNSSSGRQYESDDDASSSLPSESSDDDDSDSDDDDDSDGPPGLVMRRSHAIPVAGGESSTAAFKALEAIVELREASPSLLLKNDIKDYHLLYFACNAKTSSLFQYLAEWNTEALQTSQYEGLPISHALLKCPSFEPFSRFFRTCLIQHNPQDLGLLFQKDIQGKIACERAIEKFGKTIVFQLVQKCIPSDTEIPILHKLYEACPRNDIIHEFLIRYPNSLFQRDESDSGRTLTQAVLAHGWRTFDNDGFFFMRMTANEITELDPVTYFYPFLTAAVGASSNLSTIYFLLQKDPNLVASYIERL